ncbi:Isochorismatase-like protein [Cyathus striatus]|nr:Isochorismatase-like protein [Cyathus striatus]
MPTPRLTPATTLFFLCDVQTKFRNAIHAYDQVIVTANKMMKLANVLGCEVVATTQNLRALGPIDPIIDLQSLGPRLIGNFDKTLFSMVTSDVKSILDSRPNVNSIVLFGIESHICVLQTALSLISLPKSYFVHVVADGVSSCNSFEIPIALYRMRQEGVIVGTSESVAFQLMGDASLPTFKAFSQFVKDEKESSKTAGEILLQGKHGDNKTADGEIVGGGVLANIKSAM